MRQQSGQGQGRLSWRPFEHVLGGGTSVARSPVHRLPAGKYPILPVEREGPDQVLDAAIVGCDVTIVHVACKHSPTLEAVVDDLGRCDAVRPPSVDWRSAKHAAGLAAGQLLSWRRMRGRSAVRLTVSMPGNGALRHIATLVHFE